jgi:Uma2 family endonuclease
MSTAVEDARTLDDLLQGLGGITADRVLWNPRPGTATEADVLTLHDREDRLYELVDHVLVEKVMGFTESLLASHLIRLLLNFLDLHPLGMVTGEAGTLRLAPGLVRIPDVSFVRWDQVGGKRPRARVPNVAPDLAVEILSASNTAAEMTRKLLDYFTAGARLVWLIDPEARTVAVYTSPENSGVLTEADTLDGGDVLPGFRLPLREFFAVLDQTGPAA